MRSINQSRTGSHGRNLSREVFAAGAKVLVHDNRYRTEKGGNFRCFESLAVCVTLPDWAIVEMARREQQDSRTSQRGIEWLAASQPWGLRQTIHLPPPDDTIRIRGARVHNLQNIDLDLPRDRLVVITGPSGSGKSSLAFDTLFAEGQRQYIESLSVYARQFLHQMERPDVDLIEGLQPTISIDQRAGSQNPRSTVATVTEIYDYLRLLFARLGEPACYRVRRADPPANARADRRRPAGLARRARR